MLGQCGLVVRRRRAQQEIVELIRRQLPQRANQLSGSEATNTSGGAETPGEICIALAGPMQRVSPQY